MESKIRACIPPKVLSNHRFHTVCHPKIHIVDWKYFDKGKGRGVEIRDNKPEDIESVCLTNTSEIEVLIDAFDENALPIKKGHQAEQCECVIAPAIYYPDNWILAIETKYTHDLSLALEYYPDKMISQIVSTVEYLRETGILDNEKHVHAIISFPAILEDFSSALFQVVKGEWNVDSLLLKKRIRIKACNSANIISSKRIKLTE